MAELLSEHRVSHKAFFGLYVLAILAGVAVAVACFLIPGFGFFSPVGIVPILAAAFYAWLMQIGSSYRLFTDRLEVETGILNRRIDNLELFRVRDMGLRQNLAGRVLDYGDVFVQSTDSSTPVLNVRGIDRPRAFYQLLREQVSQSRAQHRTWIVEEGQGMVEG